MRRRSINCDWSGVTTIYHLPSLDPGPMVCEDVGRSLHRIQEFQCDSFISIGFPWSGAAGPARGCGSFPILDLLLPSCWWQLEAAATAVHLGLHPLVGWKPRWPSVASFGKLSAREHRLPTNAQRNRARRYVSATCT